MKDKVKVVLWILLGAGLMYLFPDLLFLHQLRQEVLVNTAIQQRMQQTTSPAMPNDKKE